MSTTAPSPGGQRSTRPHSPPSFDDERWLDQALSDGGRLPSAPTLTGGSPSTTSTAPELPTGTESFQLSDVLYRSHRRDWQHERRPRFTLKQEWIGRVDQVFEDHFLATLVTRAAPDEIEHAEIELDEVTPSDRPYLRKGVVFYWVIGYRDEPYGQRVGVSSVIVRRMAEPTPDQLHAADAEAKRAIAFLQNGDEASSSP